MKLFDDFCVALDEMRLNYNDLSSQNGVKIISLGVSAENHSGLVFCIVFDDLSIQIKCFEICKFPEDKNLVILQTVNKLNCDYRWVTFAATPEGKVSASIDIDIKETSSAKDIISALSRISNITDLAYPIIMKALYV